MESFYFSKVRELKREKTDLEKRLKVKIDITGKKVKISGNTEDEYDASLVLEAMQFGFSAKKSLALLHNDIIFRKIPIKQHTRRKNLKEVRGRIIGAEGKTKHTVEQISGCDVVITNDAVGLIGPALGIEEATTAVQNLIRGSKQANVYRFLERMNKEKRKMDTDLGLKLKKKE